MPSMIYSLKEMARVAYAQSAYVKLVDDSTNDEPWGPTGQQMDEVCRTYRNGGEASEEILSEIVLRLDHRKDSWRRCYKSLLLLDHMARTLPERQVRDLDRLIPLLNTIARSFYHTDSKGVDQGHNVRERAKKLTALLQDPEHLAAERKKNASTAAKVGGEGGGGDYGGVGKFHNNTGGNNVHSISASAGGGIANRNNSFGNDVGGYDNYQPGSRAQHPNVKPPTGKPLTKEEQEEADMAFAARLQQEEESRSGTRVADTDIGRRITNEGRQEREAREQAEWQRNQAAAMHARNNGIVRQPPADEEQRMAMELQARLDRGEDMETAIAALTAKNTPPPAPSTAPQQAPVTRPSTQVIDPFAPVTKSQSPPPAAPVNSDLDFFADIPQGNLKSGNASSVPQQAHTIHHSTAPVQPARSAAPHNDLDFFGGVASAPQQQKPIVHHDDFFNGPSAHSNPTYSQPKPAAVDDFFGAPSSTPPPAAHQQPASDPLMRAQLNSLDALTNTQKRQTQLQSQQGGKAPVW